MNKLRSCVVITMLAGAVVSTGIAMADAANSPHANLIGTLVCDNGQSVDLVSPSDPTPIVQVIGSNQVMVATHLQDIGTAEGTTIYDINITYAAGHGNPGGLQNDLVSCSTTYEFTSPQLGTVNGRFTVTGFFTPRNP